MRNSITAKFIAVILCAAALVGIVGSGLSFLILGSEGLLGSRDFQAVYSERTAPQKEQIVLQIARDWASGELGGISPDITSVRTEDTIGNFYDASRVYYTITDSEGNVLAANYSGQPFAEEFSRHLNRFTYEKLWEPAPPEEEEIPFTEPPVEETVPETEPPAEPAPEEIPDEAAGEEPPEEPAEEAIPEEPPEEPIPEDVPAEEPPEEEPAEEKAPAEETEAAEVTEPVTEPPVPETEPPAKDAAPSEEAPTEAVPENLITTGYYSRKLGRNLVYQYTEADDGPACDITLYLAADAPLPNPTWSILEILWGCRNLIFQILLGSLLCFAVFAVYLCCCAGHAPKSEEIKAGGLNAMPLDLYAFIFLAYLAAAAILADRFAEPILLQSLKAGAYCALAMGFVGCLIFVGFCFAFVAQIKTAGYFWFHNLLAVRLVRLCWQLLKRFCLWIVPLLFRLCRWCLSRLRALVLSFLGFLRKTGLWIGRKLEHFFGLLPLTWQWLLVGFAMIFLLLLSLVSEVQYAVLGIILFIALILYVSIAFGTLLDAARKMRNGDLETQVDEKYLVGCFKDFAGELNGLAGVAMVAAKKQLKSERMKTELITNVSHDIKTPLTSIINYVDLLTKPHTEEQEQEYLEVLSRQSERMKKLIEDLIEMSKVSSGNIAVEIGRVDAAEAVHQALGEFSGKLEAADLTPVCHCTDKDVTMMADGRLVWRAMSNLLGNAVKYAMPGTRLYVDVSAVSDKVFISIKNISRAELNISADELLERFVRGDAARNTEGSGLGLNIAKSLMEIQKGQLQLLVDGDLFKVTLVFPKAPAVSTNLLNEAAK